MQGGKTVAAIDRRFRTHMFPLLVWITLCRYTLFSYVLGIILSLFVCRDNMLSAIQTSRVLSLRKVSDPARGPLAAFRTRVSCKERFYPQAKCE